VSLTYDAPRVPLIDELTAGAENCARANPQSNRRGTRTRA